MTDAAGNSQVVTSPTVVVDNDGPSAPTAFTATAKGGGSNAIALAWRNPTNPPAPITAAMVQLCEGSCPRGHDCELERGCADHGSGAGVVFRAVVAARQPGAGWVAQRGLGFGPGSERRRSEHEHDEDEIRRGVKGRVLRVSGTMARTGRVKVSWRSKLHARTLGSGLRMVTIRKHKISATFTLNARSRRGTTRIAIRSGKRIVAQARARRAT